MAINNGQKRLIVPEVCWGGYVADTSRDADGRVNHRSPDAKRIYVDRLKQSGNPDQVRYAESLERRKDLR
ncbi:MAG: hypothetical protein J4452_04810 [Candidatus Aenigmarchaeota archaeon]|nr:hypothetical protein [Candidatus Aenigmarchaeota archaeon]